MGVHMKKKYLLISALLFSLGACQEKGNTCDPELDADSDGIHDCDEQDLGTDPTVADSDGDGLSDQEEVDCVSDPLNAEEICYACGWEHNDPDTLTSTGSAAGDVMDNIQLEDQCGDSVAMWDFYGEYHVLYMTAAW
jgi:hypothetical protein